MRKKRKWLLMNNKSQQDQVRKPKQYQGDWAALPDLCLEQIFQYLPYKVIEYFKRNQNLNLIKWKGISPKYSLRVANEIQYFLCITINKTCK